MTFVEILELILPNFLYIAAIILLIVLIILGIKMIKAVDKANRLLDNVEDKVTSLNGIFNAINFFNDRIGYASSLIVDKISDFVMKLKNKQYNDNDEEE